VRAPNLVGRISVFDQQGKFLRTIGKTGTGPGEFRTPHALVFDSQGWLIVADRHNHHVQILSKEGKFLRGYDFGRVSGLAIDKNDLIYASDSESTEKVHPGWLKGIRAAWRHPLSMYVSPQFVVWRTRRPMADLGLGLF
jgi:6-bladed beta-propeller protein